MPEFFFPSLKGDFETQFQTLYFFDLLFIAILNVFFIILYFWPSLYCDYDSIFLISYFFDKILGWFLTQKVLKPHMRSAIPAEAPKIARSDEIQPPGYKNFVVNP